MKTLLIGNGYWGKIVKSKLEVLTELVGICDSKTNLDTFLDNDINLVFVCVDTKNHFNVIKKCIEYRKNIFCEKPFTGDIKKAEYLYEYSDKNNTKIYVDNIFLYTDVFKSINENGNNIKFIWKKYDTNYKESLYDSLLYHDIYLLLTLTEHKEWKLVYKEINDTNLYLKLQNESKICEIFYDRNYFTKTKKIIIDNKIFDFSNNTNDSLYNTIENLLNNKIDFSKNRTLTLDTLNLLSYIKNI